MIGEYQNFLKETFGAYKEQLRESEFKKMEILEEMTEQMRRAGTDNKEEVDIKRTIQNF